MRYYCTCSIVENTKEYICRAVVTMVDHLGNVSSNLTSLLSQASSITNIELRINSLKQVQRFYLVIVINIQHQ